MSRKTKLKPCPFCGSMADLFCTRYRLRPEWWFAQCPNKECHIYLASHNVDETINKWNTRVKG